MATVTARKKNNFIGYYVTLYNLKALSWRQFGHVIVMFILVLILYIYYIVLYHVNYLWKWNNSA